MDWIKKNYERALLGLSAFALMACAGWLSFQALSFPESFSARNTSKKQENKLVAPEIKSVAAAADLAEAPGIWTSHESSVFISRPYVLRDGKLVDPLEAGEALHPPITNKWLMDNNIDYASVDVKDQDPDGDHFTNLEEFIAATDPNKPGSTPPYTNKLRLIKFDPIPFMLTFTGDSGVGYGIKKGRDTVFPNLGEMIKDTPYKVVACEKVAEIIDSSTGNVIETISSKNAGYAESLASYRKKYAAAKEAYDKSYNSALAAYKTDRASEYAKAEKKLGKARFDYIDSLDEKFKKEFRAKNKVDCPFTDPEEITSIITVENTETGQKIPLVLNKPANDPTSFGEFLYLYDGSKFRVKKGEEFSLAPDLKRKYKLVEISANEAEIEDAAEGVAKKEKFRIIKGD